MEQGGLTPRSWNCVSPFVTISGLYSFGKVKEYMELIGKGFCHSKEYKH